MTKPVDPVGRVTSIKQTARQNRIAELRLTMDETRVLVVDDDEPIRRLIGTVLRRAGYGIDEARHGGEAVGMMQENDYDVVLLDLMMPVLSGFEVIDWLAENDQDRLGCVVVMSAAADRDLARLDPQVVFSVLRKPFDLAAVVETVAECAERARALEDGVPTDQSCE